MIYCDTALLVAALVPFETTSDQAEAWLSAQLAGTLAASWWVETEFASAIAMKVRRGDLQPSDRARVIAAWAALHDSFEWLAVEQRHFMGAVSLLSAPDTRLRSGDALHLAIALGHGYRLATFDAILAEAANTHGASAPLTL